MGMSAVLSDNVIDRLCNIVLARHGGCDCRVTADINGNINHLRRHEDAHSRALQRSMLPNGENHSLGALLRWAGRRVGVVEHGTKDMWPGWFRKIIQISSRKGILVLSVS